MVERVGPDALLLTQNIAAVMKYGIEDCKVQSSLLDRKISHDMN
jgi:hypothetical protein